VTINVPSNLTGSHTDTNRVTLQWHDNSSNEGGFRIERSTSDTGYTAIGVVLPNIVTFTDTSVFYNIVYNYRVCAVAGAYQTAYSNVCVVPVMTMNAPSNLIAVRTGISTVALHWQDNSTNETGFVLERSNVSANGPFSSIVNLAPNLTSYTDSYMSVDTTYFYRIFAVRGSLHSAYSLFTLPINFPPSVVTGYSPANGAINQNLGVDLNWNPSTDPELDTVKYTVHLFYQNGSNWVDSLLATALTMTHYRTERLSAGTTYRWFVVPYDVYHQPTTANIVNAPSLTTSTNSSSYVEWNDLPHSGLVTLIGRASEFGYYRAGQPQYYDTLFADTLHVDQSVFYTQINALSFGGLTLVNFPLVASTDTILNSNVPTSLSLYLSNGFISANGQRFNISSQDITIGSTTFHCSAIKFFYDFEQYGYGSTTYHESISLYFAPEIGLVRAEVSYAYTYSQMSWGEGDDKNVSYSITAP